MHLLCPARVVPSLILAFVFAVSLTAHATTPGSPGVDRAALLITSAVVDPSLERVAEGYVEWIRVRARQSGARVVAGGEVRRAVDELRRASPQADLRPDQGALLELAQRSDVGHALLVDLRARHGAIDVDLRLYRVAERKLVGGGLVQALAGRVGHETEQALGVLERRLGLELTQQAPHALRSINLAALTAASRALVLIDRGELGSAWRELGNGSNPLAASLRDQIDRLAARPTTSPVALAHLENARGEAARAWEHVAERVHEAHGQPAQAASTLIAAGDAQLAIGGLGKARAYYDRVLEVEPRNAQATLGVARVLATERKPEAAREVLDRVAALDVDSPVALELAAETVEHDPALRAQYLMRAASRRARRLDTEVAQRQWAQAVKLDVTLEGPVARHAADLHAVTGDYENALEDYGRARGAGEVDPGLLVAEARTQRAAGMPQQAAVTLETVLQDHDPEHEDTLLELGDLYIEGERPAEAIALLERASANAPEGPRADRTLARALTLRGEPGDHPRALQLLTESNDEASWETRDLRTLASLQAEAGDFDAATRSLERAIGLRELDPAVQQDIVALMNEQGDTEAAGRWASRFSHSGLGQFVESDLEGAGDPIGRHLGGFDEIAALVDSFAKSDKPPMKVVLQGVREPLGPRGLALDMLMPRTTDMASVMAAINETLAPQYVLIEGAELGENFRREVENLFAFDEQASLSVRTLTDLNLAHGSDAVFVARITRKTGESDAPFGSCWASDHYLLEMRRLAGQTDDQAQVLSNQACLAGGAAGSFGTWNRKAAALYGVLCMLLVFPFLRGWGRLRVDFQLPEGAAAFFAVSLTRHPSKVRDRSEKTRASATNVFRNRLRRVRRSERRLEGNRMEFRWVPARRGHYYVTIRGPLVDLASNSLIGEFLEERVVQIQRGQHTRMDFDLRTHEAMVSVIVKRGSESACKARVSVRGKPGSARYCHEGKGAIYLPEGEHIVVVGSDDRVAEQTLVIQGTAPSEMTFDLEYEFVFEGCPEAVEPYVEGDYAQAARVLTREGQGEIACEIGRFATPPADHAAAASATSTFEAAEFDREETTLERSSETWAEVARTHDEAGDQREAADAYREAGDIVNAARCYEEAYDWDNAIECYQDLGDTENVLALMERSGELYEAGMLAAEVQQLDRAIYDLQQVDSRHSRYSECCRKLAELFAERGEQDLAIEKFHEGLQISGTSEVALEILDQYARMLEAADRNEEALEIWMGIRRRDVHYDGVNTQIEQLRKQLSEALSDPVHENAATVIAAREPAPAAALASRYEVQGELGRGGMGIVYRALDTHLQRVVALKVLSENLREHETALELFLREARSAAALNHRNIVTVYDAGQEGEMDFISMECLEGSGVDTILKHNGALNPRMVASLGLQVAAGLDYAQKNKIIHRDIKPSNLFVTSERIVKIMDFGLAKMVEEVRRATTIIGGTPNYMAPEQAVGEATDHRADLYALGGTLFHLLTGSVPYETGDVTYQHAHGPVPDPRERELSVPAPLAELVMKLMAKAPEDRPQTAREVGVALQAYLKASG